MKRRTFVKKAGIVVAAGSVLASCGDGRSQSAVVDSDAVDQDTAASPGAASPSGDRSWGWVRDQFRLSPQRAHLSAMLVASHPRPVREAIARYRRRLDEEPVTYLEAENDQRKAAVRAAAASYIGGEADEVALTDSTTEGIALVYNGLRLQPGDEVVTTEHDYYATHEALRLTVARTGATTREIVLYDRPESISKGRIVDSIRRSIGPDTRALALTWVHSNTGLKLPVRDIADVVAEANAERNAEERVLLCVDGVHGFGVEDVTMEELGCDLFMAGCHKWLFGPRGTGIVWGRRDAWARLRPTIPSFMDDESWEGWAEGEPPDGSTTAARMSPGGFQAFEHQWAMKDAFQFHQEIGKAAVAGRTHALARQLKEGLAQMPGITLYTPQDEQLSAGIVCFDVDGTSPETVVDHLLERDVVATTTPYAVSYARLTPSIYNTPEEVDTALRAIRELT